MVQPPTPVDPDGDGIAGEADRCPGQPEDTDSFEDEDGCPDNDNDRDGILDTQDRCPLRAETINSIDDEDGCPEEDTDQDGFLGSRDKCPDAPESKNGFQDDDGCPDELPPEVKKFTGVIEGINFKTGSASILPGSFTILDRAVQVLQEYPTLKLEIQGHTDNRGRAAYNLDLSQRRAEAVRTYFVTRGLKPERVTAIGFGMERPIADNQAESGRSRNRRTEFRIVTEYPPIRQPGRDLCPLPPGSPGSDRDPGQGGIRVAGRRDHHHRSLPPCSPARFATSADLPVPRTRPTAFLSVTVNCTAAAGGVGAPLEGAELVAGERCPRRRPASRSRRPRRRR